MRVIRERIVSGAVPSELIRRILPSREFKSCAPAAQRAVPVVIQSLPSGPILICPPSWMLAPRMPSTRIKSFRIDGDSPSVRPRRSRSVGRKPSIEAR